MTLSGIRYVISALPCVAAILGGILTLLPPPASAGVLTTSERAAQLHEEFLKGRRLAISTRENPYLGPRVAQVINEPPPPWKVKKSPWHYQIRATVFWVGERSTPGNPTPNTASSWDPNWEENFGGYDHPFKREEFLPAGFAPKLNPFYIALPYNDLVEGRSHRPEASSIIPWFWQTYKGPGVSVCHNRWIVIHHKGKVAYAQWKDVGPFTVNDWPYVFQGEQPRPNRNKNAGIDVSPAVRDFLAMRGNAEVDWKFVEESEVPAGPWAKWIHPAIAPSDQTGELPTL
jgi:hypothetical protein